VEELETDQRSAKLEQLLGKMQCREADLPTASILCPVHHKPASIKLI